MARRFYSSTAARTTLATGVDDTTTTLSVTAVSGWPSSFPYTLILDQDTVNEEIVEVSARSGTTLTVTRGVDGTSAVAHSSGAAVQHGVSARDFDEPNAFINGTGTVTETMLASNAVTSAKILDGTIVNADINASAAIAQSKIADLTSDLASKPTFTYGTATPTADAEGAIWYDENDTPPTPKYWDGSAWQPFSSGIGAAAISSPAATGQYTDTGITYDYYVFTSSGTLTVDDNGSGFGGFADVLVIGGGGGGGAANIGAGGGGGGGHLYATDVYIPAGSLTVTVGAGGSGAAGASGTIPSGGGAQNGVASRLGNYYSPGGGGGGGASGTNVVATAGSNGGSGGGGTYGGAGGGGDIGNTGGTGSAAGSNFGGGGGGGGNAAGSAGTGSAGGNGGSGEANSITGSSITRAGGGGGGALGGTAGIGGVGGGAAGSNSSTAASNGTVNTGGGGGGGGRTSTVSGNGGNGGSGVVIVRVKV
jgi:hypothetical protein